MPRVISEENTRKYWARLYGWSRQYFAEILKDVVGITHSGLLTPLDRQLMFSKLGDPRIELAA